MGPSLSPSSKDDDRAFQHFYSSFLDAWRFSVFSELAERKGFR